MGDGIVLDDMSFAHLPRETIIHLLDWDVDRSIHCRYNCAYIPHGTRKIFTTNKHPADVFGQERWEEKPIKRRITGVIHIDKKLFDDPTMVEDSSQEEIELDDLRVWSNGELIRDANGNATTAVPPALRDVGIFRTQEVVDTPIEELPDDEYLDRMERLLDEELSQ